MNPAREELAGLIRPDAVHSSVYADPEIFGLEMDRVFGHAWLLLGHQSSLPVPGSWMATRMGREPVTVVRGRDGRLRAFINRCPHRGATVCLGDSGRVDSITCPYHGWSFDLEGSLKFVPAAHEYDGGVARSASALTPVPRLEMYRGFLFGSLLADGPSLSEFLGSMLDVIDDLVDRAPEDDLEVAPAVLRHRYRGNWKLSFENLNDTVHAGVAHVAAARAAQRVIGSIDDPSQHPLLGMMVANAKPLAFFHDLESRTESRGHSVFGAHMPTEYPEPLQSEYFAALAAKRGEKRATEILSRARHMALVYPGSFWHARYQTVRVIHPLAPDLTEIVTWSFRLKGAPEGTYDSALQYCTGSSSALSTIITDDLDIYEGIQRTATAAPGWLSIARGAGTSANGAFPQKQPATSEAFIRNQYRAWLESLCARSGK